MLSDHIIHADSVLPHRGLGNSEVDSTVTISKLIGL